MFEFCSYRHVKAHLLNLCTVKSPTSTETHMVPSHSLKHSTCHEVCCHNKPVAKVPCLPVELLPPCNAHSVCLMAQESQGSLYQLVLSGRLYMADHN